MTKNFKSNSDDKKNLPLKKQQRIYAKQEIIGRSVHMIGDGRDRRLSVYATIELSISVVDQRVICTVCRRAIV